VEQINFILTSSKIARRLLLCQSLLYLENPSLRNQFGIQTIIKTNEILSNKNFFPIFYFDSFSSDSQKVEIGEPTVLSLNLKYK